MTTSNLINGVFTDYISINDRGLHYGDGVFETIACLNRQPQFLTEHLLRMQLAANTLSIDYPGDEVILSDVATLLEKTSDDNCVIKLILTRGQGPRGYRSPHPQQVTRILQLSGWPHALHQNTEQAVSLCLCRHTVSSNSALSGLKHLNRLDNVIARNEWNDAYYEGLLSDETGHIIEGTMSNVFFVRKKVLITPALDTSGVDGIIRQQIIQIASEQKIACEALHIHKKSIHNMDEAFICNSLIGITPVSSIENINFKHHDTTSILQQKLQLKILSQPDA